MPSWQHAMGSATPKHKAKDFCMSNRRCYSCVFFLMLPISALNKTICAPQANTFTSVKAVTPNTTARVNTAQICRIYFSL